MNKKEKRWGLVILILVFLGYVLPYTLLRGVTYWYGSFLVWVLLALIIVLINVIITRGWGDRS